MLNVLAVAVVEKYLSKRLPVTMPQAKRAIRLYKSSKVLSNAREVKKISLEWI